MKTVIATGFRTKMIGGGTGYDVYINLNSGYMKHYRPITSGQYATTIFREGSRFYAIDDFLRTREIDSLPIMSEERRKAFKALRLKATRLRNAIALKLFPELKPLREIPFLWANWTKPSTRKEIAIQLPDKYFA